MGRPGKPAKWVSHREVHRAHRKFLETYNAMHHGIEARVMKEVMKHYGEVKPVRMVTENATAEVLQGLFHRIMEEKTGTTQVNAWMELDRRIREGKISLPKEVRAVMKKRRDWEK